MHNNTPRSESAVAAVICLSGGMDSTSLLLRLLASGLEVFCLSFDYGQKHRIELECVQHQLEYVGKECNLPVKGKLINLSDLGNLFHSALLDSDWEVPTGHYEQEQMKQTVVPNRNAIFASIAFGYALSIANQEQRNVRLALGVHSGDHTIYPDCRPEFFRAIDSAFRLGNWDSERVQLELPYLEFNKFQILQDAQLSSAKLGLDFQRIFRNTITSYRPDAKGVSHGLTGSDVERILAFDQLGIPDPIAYRRPWPVVVREARRLEKEWRAQKAAE